MRLQRFNSSLLLFVQRTLEPNINSCPRVGFVINPDINIIAFEKVNNGLFTTSGK